MCVNNDAGMTLSILLGDLVNKKDFHNISTRYQEMLSLSRTGTLTRLSGKEYKVPYHRKVLNRIIKLRSLARDEFGARNKRESSVQFLVRVDDFPAWDLTSDKFRQFHSILSRNKIQYLLGVTPQVCKDPLNPKSTDYKELNKVDLKILEELSASEVEFGLHGLTHQTTNSFSHSEIVGLDYEALELKISRGLEKLQDIVPKISVFMPPFNAFDLNSLDSISKHFDTICGGPESIHYVGLKLSPSFVKGVLYGPSYYPAYGKAKQILSFAEDAEQIFDFIVVPLSLHWRWEIQNNFKDVEKLCKVISGRVISWSTLRAQSKIAKLA